MDIKEALENLKTAVYEVDHQISVYKAIIAELIEHDPALYERIMEKLNLI